MAIPRYAILNLARDRIGVSRVDYRDADWATSAVATDSQHSEDILVGDLWQAMKQVAADSRDKWERRKIRLIANQYEYSLPQDCMTILEVVHNFYGSWTEINYLYHNEFFTGFSENILGYPPRFFTLQAQTSNPVHSVGAITTANAGSPPILIDTSANFGITLTGEDINPGDKIFNITDDSSGYVKYLHASSWKVESATADSVEDNVLYDVDVDFVTSEVSVGDIIWTSGVTYTTYSSVDWAVITNIQSANRVRYNIAYGDNENLDTAVGYSYHIGKADRIYLTSSGLVKDTEEGLVGGAEGDFDEDDEYQVEDYYSTLDTLLLSESPSTTDTLGTESMMLIYVPYPKQPLKHYHPVELSEAYTPAIIAKMVEYAKVRERGETPQYEWLLDKGIGQRKLYNQGRLGHKRTQRRGRATNIISWQDVNLVDHRGI